MRANFIGIAMAIASSGSLAQSNMKDLIEKAHHDKAAIPSLVKALHSGHVTIIASWSSPESTAITIQDFIRDGQSYIPLFSMEAEFKAEAAGSPYEQKGVSIDANLFFSMLHGSETLILNPRSETPVTFSAQDLKAVVDPSRLPKLAK